MRHKLTSAVSKMHQPDSKGKTSGRVQKARVLGEERWVTGGGGRLPVGLHGCS